MIDCGDSIREVHPLFRAEGDGSIPISPLQLEIARMPIDIAVTLNAWWHSRLPRIAKPHNILIAYAAFFGNRYYAVGIWGPPVARAYKGRSWLELRRLSIAHDAPRYTASRMLRIMRLLISREFPGAIRLISYQDTAVHHGTIYRAAGWIPAHRSKGDDWDRPNRQRSSTQTNAPKVRWECPLS